MTSSLAEAILDVADAQLEHLDGLGVAHRDDPAAFDLFDLIAADTSSNTSKMTGGISSQK